MATTNWATAARRAAPALAAAALPWSWFLVRDRSTLLDVVATGLPVVVGGLAGAALVLAALFRLVVLLVATASLLLMGTVAVVGPWLPGGGPAPLEPVRVVSVNAFEGNATPSQAAADIRAQDADVVLFVEGPASVGQALESAYPFRAFGMHANHELFSRFPVRQLPTFPGETADGRVSRWELMAPTGRVVVYGVHLDRPRPRDGTVRSSLVRQRDVVGSILSAIAGEPSPTLLLGDFNLSDRTLTYRRLAGPLRDAGRASMAGPTYVRSKYRPFLLRIDHVFVSRNWCAGGGGRFTITGSDHRGVVAEVGPCPR